VLLCQAMHHMELESATCLLMHLNLVPLVMSLLLWDLLSYLDQESAPPQSPRPHFPPLSAHQEESVWAILNLTHITHPDPAAADLMFVVFKVQNIQR
jgi:hypothetical protein